MATGTGKEQTYRRERRGRRGPKGLTRALKIENSKWPIFPADGTETKSRPAFIMTCIAVRALCAVICTLFRCRTQRVGIGENARETGKMSIIDVCVRTPSYVYMYARSPYIRVPNHIESGEGGGAVNMGAH